MKTNLILGAILFALLIAIVGCVLNLGSGKASLDDRHDQTLSGTNKVNQVEVKLK